MKFIDLIKNLTTKTLAVTTFTAKTLATKNLATLLLTSVILFGAISLNTGCAQKPAAQQNANSSSSTGPVSAAGLAAFQSGLYAFAQTQGCAVCHGNSNAPLFAVTDVNAAYLAAKPFVNFTTPASSLIITYAGNGHCGGTSCSSPAIDPTVQGLITTWVNAENAAPPPAPGPGGGATSGPAYMTGSVSLPTTLATLMSSATPSVIRFQLSALKPAVASLSNAILEVEVRNENGNEYRFANPKIAGNTVAVNIAGLHLYVRSAATTGIGNEDPNTGLAWATITGTAPIFARPGTLPAGPLGATPLTTTPLFDPIQGGSTINVTPDVVTIGFGAIN